MFSFFSLLLISIEKVFYPTFFLFSRFCDMVLSFPLTSQQPVMMKLQQTFAFLRYTLRAIYSPSDLLKSARPPWFESGRQQDCSEFLRYLLDTLQEQEKSARNGSVFREHRVIEPPKNNSTSAAVTGSVPMDVQSEADTRNRASESLDAISEAPETAHDVDMISQEGT